MRVEEFRVDSFCLNSYCKIFPLVRKCLSTTMPKDECQGRTLPRHKIQVSANSNNDFAFLRHFRITLDGKSSLQLKLQSLITRGKKAFSSNRARSTFHSSTLPLFSLNWIISSAEKDNCKFLLEFLTVKSFY